MLKIDLGKYHKKSFMTISCLIIGLMLSQFCLSWIFSAGQIDTIDNKMYTNEQITDNIVLNSSVSFVIWLETIHENVTEGSFNFQNIIVSTTNVTFVPYEPPGTSVYATAFQLAPGETKTLNYAFTHLTLFSTIVAYNISLVDSNESADIQIVMTLTIETAKLGYHLITIITLSLTILAYISIIMRRKK
ncbi:MAG: hypothetical protein JXA54_15745 [Candidatus Heimdallarchaeota archaeon]|nr:hypothetical protein [Candidatus Heimdallarchaeota archaeon]